MRIARFINFLATAGIILLTSFVFVVDADIVSSSRDHHHDRPPLVHPQSRADGGAAAATTMMRVTDDYAQAYPQKQGEEKNGDETVLGSATTDPDVKDKHTDNSDNEEPRLRSFREAEVARYGGNSALSPRDAAFTVTVTATEPYSSSNSSTSRVFEAQQELRGSSMTTSLLTTTAMNTNNATAASAETTATRCTPINWTNNYTFTTDAACPTPYENGTYCGFVSPKIPCAMQPGGHGGRMHPDTPEVFLAHAPFHHAALRAPTPAGYRPTFFNLHAAANPPEPDGIAAHDPRNGSSSRNTPASAISVPPLCYMGYHLLTSYDPAACAALCDTDPSGACAAFNLYVERDPEWNPWRCSCDRPRAVANYKCALFSGAEAVEDAGRATNFGQHIKGSSFERKIVGSNGYVKIGGAAAEEGRKGGACQDTKKIMMTTTMMGGGGSGSGQASAAGVLATATVTMLDAEGGGTGSLTPVVGGGPFSLGPLGPTSSSTLTGATASSSASSTPPSSEVEPSGNGSGQSPPASTGAPSPCVSSWDRIVVVGLSLIVPLLLW
ncbi:hypothetical protein PG994_009719 [Apiospora phragmitis]|uniref:Extracellular membrane protein CFEM domain-containing protein n=1 Tax=Apiospora phragmitis TaxID=2905665 RepID=A0ABR1U7G6_9PEZI